MRVVGDVEVFKNFHSCSFIDIDANQYYEFVVHESCNQLESYVNFLKKVDTFIGYNNIGYDDHILHYVLENADYWLLEDDVNYITKKIYQKSCEIISQENIRIWKKNYQYKPIDLYLIWHYNNPDRRCSLKQLEVALQHHNVQDLPYFPDHVVTPDQIDDIMLYNKNDVDITYEFYKRTLPKLHLRESLGKIYDMDFTNDNDVKMGVRIAEKYYQKYSGKDRKDFIKLRTPRYSIDLKDCVPDYVKFQTTYLNNFLDVLKNTSVRKTKGEFESDLHIGGNTYNFKLGGLHSEDKPRIISRGEDEVLVEKDVASMYPSMIINQKVYPEHLGVEFLKGYADIYHKRLEAKPKAKIDPEASAISDGLKLALNGTYGKLGSEHSWLYDNKALLKVTIGGQLAVLMLIEAFEQAGIRVVSANTDGVVIKYKQTRQDVVDKIHDWWQKQTGLILENTHYKQLIMNSVNDYIAELDNGYLKFKGDYEIDKDYHKDHSNKVVRIALKRYFIDHIPVEETIRNHDNIYDFCLSSKMKSDSRAVLVTRKGEQILGKVNRYYVSNTGHKIIKKYDKGTSEELVADQSLTLFNVFEQKDDYDINYHYYIKEANKLIRKVESNNQLTIYDLY